MTKTKLASSLAAIAAVGVVALAAPVERADAYCSYGWGNAPQGQTGNGSGSYGYGSKYPTGGGCGPADGFQRVQGWGVIPYEEMWHVAPKIDATDGRNPYPDFGPTFPYYAPWHYKTPAPYPQQATPQPQPQPTPQPRQDTPRYEPYLDEQRPDVSNGAEQYQVRPSETQTAGNESFIQKYILGAF